ncbi:unnamed protein product [Arctogadus glacialis]
MRFSIYMTMLLLWVSQDPTKCEKTGVVLDTIRVAVGEPLTLNCTYDCSPGFVRGCWSPEEDSGTAGCLGTITQNEVCTVSLQFPNISMEDVGSIQVCYSENTAHPELKRQTERRVELQIHGQRDIPSWTTGSDTASSEIKWTEMITPSIPTQPKDSGEVAGMNTLQRSIAIVGIALVGLGFFLLVKYKRKGGPVDSVKDRPTSLGSHANRSPAREDQSDSEVAYADIVITVRGASSPELAQICYGSHEDQRERWRDETYLSPFPASHLPQISRSADRLNVIPREISRKLSTNSEYAIITYS